MGKDRSHYVKTTRDAALPMDAAMYRLINEGYAHAWNTTQFTINDQYISATPLAADDKGQHVMNVLVEEFSRAGWSGHAQSRPHSEDTNQTRISVSFGHPNGKTRCDEPPVQRPTLLYFEVPMPDPAIPITPEIIDYWAEQAANVARSLMAQQVVKEEWKMPGSPGQGGDDYRPPAMMKVEPYDPETTQPTPRPLYQAFGVEPDEEDRNE